MAEPGVIFDRLRMRVAHKSHHGGGPVELRFVGEGAAKGISVSIATQANHSIATRAIDPETAEVEVTIRILPRPAR